MYIFSLCFDLYTHFQSKKMYICSLGCVCVTQSCIFHCLYSWVCSGFKTIRLYVRGVMGWGVCYQPLSSLVILMPQFQIPYVKNVYVALKILFSSKFCLLIDPWTRTLDCWSCGNLSSLVLVEQEYDRIPDLGAAETNLLKNSRQQKMGYVPQLRVLPCYLENSLSLRSVEKNVSKRKAFFHPCVPLHTFPSQ